MNTFSHTHTYKVNINIYVNAYVHIYACDNFATTRKSAEKILGYSLASDYNLLDHQDRS